MVWGGSDPRGSWFWRRFGDAQVRAPLGAGTGRAEGMGVAFVLL